MQERGSHCSIIHSRQDLLASSPPTLHSLTGLGSVLRALGEDHWSLSARRSQTKFPVETLLASGIFSTLRLQARSRGGNLGSGTEFSILRWESFARFIEILYGYVTPLMPTPHCEPLHLGNFVPLFPLSQPSSAPYRSGSNAERQRLFTKRRSSFLFRTSTVLLVCALVSRYIS